MGIGVKYCGSFMDYSGYGSANRAFITALYVGGADVTTELVTQVRDKADHGWQGKLALGLEDRNVPYRVKVIHLTPDIYPKYMEHDKYNIGHLFWETDRLPKPWIEPCNKMGEIWTSSAHMAELLKRSGVKVPIYWFPQPVDIHVTDKPMRAFKVRNQAGYLFYSIFHWIERKNPRALITSYLEEFDGVEDVTLLLKVHGVNFDETEFEKIKQNIHSWKREVAPKKPPRVLLCKRLLSQEDIWRLHKTGDCFVQPDRGEGWSRPIQEALLMGNPVISTARGGIHEYLFDEHYFRIDSTYVPVVENPSIPWYTEDQNWAEVDRTQLKKTMRFVYENQAIVKAKGIVAKDFIKDNFSYHRVGKMMLERLERIYKGL